jgi:hypothetical protein
MAICNECGRRADGVSPEHGPICDRCAEKLAGSVPRCTDCGRPLDLAGECPVGCEQEVGPFVTPAGHVVGCPVWARAWRKHYGAENLDRTTLDNLAASERRPTGCPVCLAEQAAAEVR